MKTKIAIFTESAQLNKKLHETFAIRFTDYTHSIYCEHRCFILWLGGYNVSMGSLQVG